MVLWKPPQGIADERLNGSKSMKMQCFPLYTLLLALGSPTVDFLSLDIEVHPPHIVFKTNFSTQKRVPSWRCCKLFHGQRFGNFWLRNKHCKKSVSFLASHAQVDIKAISVETEFLDMEKRFDLKFRNIFNEDISGDVDMHWHLQDYLNHDMMLNWWKE